MKKNVNYMKKLLRGKFGKNSTEYRYFCELALGLPNEQTYGLFLDLMAK